MRWALVAVVFVVACGSPSDSTEGESGDTSTADTGGEGTAGPSSGSTSSAGDTGSATTTGGDVATTSTTSGSPPPCVSSDECGADEACIVECLPDPLGCQPAACLAECIEYPTVDKCFDDRGCCGDDWCGLEGVCMAAGVTPCGGLYPACPDGQYCWLDTTRPELGAHCHDECLPRDAPDAQCVLDVPGCCDSDVCSSLTVTCVPP